MNEDYCNYELSLALKVSGFDEPCDHYWSKEFANSDKVVLRQAPADDYNNDNWYVLHCSAPHIYHAQKWLREKHHLHVNISTDGERSWTTNINGWNKEDIPVGYLHPVNVQTYDTYEQALSAGIAATLELIKKGE